MVRPIEISDSMTKAEAVQRVQQNQKIQPEAAQHFQKTTTERLTEQATTANPVPRGDEIVLHVNEQEEEKRKAAQHERHPSRENRDGEKKKESQRDNKDNEPPHDHIDIKI